MNDSSYRKILGPLRYKTGGKLQAYARKLRAAYYRLFYVIGRDVNIGANCRLEGQGIQIGNRVTVDEQSFLISPVKLGNDIYINRQCVLSNVVLGNNVLVGYGCKIFGDSRDITDNPDMRGGYPIEMPVVIGDGALIGTATTVLPGVEIGHGTIIASGSTVTEDCEPNCLYGGTPAKKISTLPTSSQPNTGVVKTVAPLPIGVNDILILYPDLLGDYLLFRNTLNYLRKNVDLNGRKIAYLGNAASRPLVEFLDPDLADCFTWIQDFSQTHCALKKRLLSFLFTRQWMAACAKLGLPHKVHQIWCPSTGPWVVNGITNATVAHRKLGKDMESPDLRLLQRITYTDLYKPGDFHVFNFDQHRAFFAQATGQSFDGVQYHFPKEKFTGCYTRQVLQKPYCLVFPDSMESFKQWPVRHVARFIQHLLAETNLTVYIAGHVSKRYLGQKIQKLVSHERAINLMGKTDLIEVFDVIGQSQFVVCNDSFALHAANAMARPVVCITQGLYPGRYLPYPQQYRQAPHYYIYPPVLGQGLETITPQQVLDTVKPLLRIN